MIDKDFFSQYQKQLVWFANTHFGKWFLKIDSNKKIISITPSSYTSFEKIKDGKIFFKSNFTTTAQYSKKLNALIGWLPFNTVRSEYKKGQWYLVPKFGLTTTTVYPDASTGATTVDGQISVNGDVSNGSWASKRGAATGDAAFPTTSNMRVGLECSNDAGNPWRTISRSAFLFDTSSIGDTDTIDTATISLYCEAKANNFAALTSAQKDLEIVDSTPAANNNLTTADFDQFGTTTYSTVNYDSISALAYNDFVLSSAGEGQISKTGISKFGVRMGADMDNSEPTFDSAKEIVVRFSAADNGSNKPTLVVTHTAAVTSSSKLLLLGVG